MSPAKKKIDEDLAFLEQSALFLDAENLELNAKKTRQIAARFKKLIEKEQVSAQLFEAARKMARRRRDAGINKGPYQVSKADMDRLYDAVIEMGKP